MRRREFLIASSMSAAAVLVARPISARAAVYDPRYAREFAQRYAAQGVPVFRTDSCMVRLWRGPLSQVLGRSDARIAGLTSYSDFTIARECARDRGLTVLHEEWCRTSPVTLVSWLIGAS